MTVSPELAQIYVRDAAWLIKNNPDYAKEIARQVVGHRVMVRATGLTQGQADALDFISDYIARFARSPSFKEIADGLEVASKSTVSRYVAALARRGCLTYEPALARSITLCEVRK